MKERTRREDGSDLQRSERLRARQAGGGRMGKAMLMLGVLGVLSGQAKAQEVHDDHHEVMLEVMRNKALGLEMAEGMAIGVEVT
jgi:hypothetical protein